MYDISLIWKRIVRSKGYYIFIVLELLICNALVVVGIDERISYEKFLNDPRRYDYDRGYADVGIEFEQDADRRRDVLSPSVKNNPNLLYAISEEAFLWYEENGQPEAKVLYVLRVNQAFFDLYFGFQAQPSKLYTKNLDSVIDLFRNMTKVSPEQEIRLNDSNLLHTKFGEYELSSLPMPLKPQELYLQGIEEPWDLEWTCFILDSETPILQDDNPYTFLKVKLVGINFKELSAAILADTRVKKVYDRYPYAVELRAVRQTSSNIQLLGWLGLATTFLVAIGLTGTMLILLNKRRNELATTQILGASIRRIWFQTVAEVALVYSFGLLLSIPFRSYMLDSLFILPSAYTVEASLLSFILVGCLMVLNVLLISLVCMWKIKKMALTEVLRG